MLRIIVLSLRHPVSALGAAVTTSAALLILVMVLLEGLGFVGGPYLGVLTFVAMPTLLVVGLLLIPVGILLQRRREARSRVQGILPVFDLNRRSTRRIFASVFVLTIANVLILSMATVKGVHTMESTEFCGSCHSVMQPETTAHMRSPHARVDCVDCHIGPGADWFVKSKLSGAWQVVSTTFELYPKPIPTPIHNLRPARDTCEQCHWPEKFVGDKLEVLTHYAEDEENSETKTVLLLRVGGIEGRESRGIHWHVDPKNTIRYRSDPSRETIYDVELTLPDGSIETFRVPGSEDVAGHGEGEELEWRTMDCIDCHNRPTHVYLTPEHALSSAIENGAIATDLPFIVREGMAAIGKDYESHGAARVEIASYIDDFYRREYPEVHEKRRDDVDSAAEALADAYAANVFPSMNVGWNTYPDHIGHEQSPGCFRCHDGEHESDRGRVISQDCSTCHSLLAWDEGEPEILDTLNP